MNKKMKDIKIKCKCGCEEFVQAKYCSYCQREFSSEQINEAYKKTPFSKSMELKEKYSKISKIKNYLEEPVDQLINKIANKKPIKIIVIVLCLVLGTFMYATNRPLWRHLFILPTSEYSVTKGSEKYYLTASVEEIELKIGCAKEVEKASIVLDDSNQEVIDKESKVKVIKGATYKLNVDYKDGTSEELEFEFNYN